MIYTVKRDNSRIDVLAQEIYGFQAGAVEALLAANTGLSDICFAIPAGTEIICPDVSKPVKKSLKLWD